MRTKEIKLRPQTQDHDLEVKIRHIRRFIEAGDKVRITVQYRGREVVHPEFGQAMLAKVAAAIADVATCTKPVLSGKSLSCQATRSRA